MKTFDATVKATITMKVGAETKEEAIRKVKRTVPTRGVNSNSGETLYTITIEDVHITEVGIMDTSNGHDPWLVDKINQCYSKKIDLFFAIVRSLAERDVDEIGDICDTGIDDMTKKDLARLYCNRIADDRDLVTIINYCRM